MKVLVGGGIASGKTTVAKHVEERLEFPRTSTGSIIRAYHTKHGLSGDREALQATGQVLVEKGFPYFVDWLIAHSQEGLWEGNLIVDGLRNVAMYQELARRFPRHILVFCDCSREKQLERMQQRDSLSSEDAMRILDHPTEQYVGTLKSAAHIILDANASKEAILQELDEKIAVLMI